MFLLRSRASRLPAATFSLLFIACTGSASMGNDAGPDEGAPDLPPPIIRPTIPDWWEEPLEGPADEWTWIDFPGTHCGDGSPTGIAVNFSPAANPSGLLLYMEGGGACWTQEDCSASVAGLGLALHMGGYDEDTWNGLWGTIYMNAVMFRRDQADNPWRDAHYVFLPYCTGDVFAGDAVRALTSEDGDETETFYFKGFDNVRQFLARIVPTFHDVDRVWLTGSSAGGFGAALNWFQTADKFEGVRVDVLADSGQPIDPIPGRFATWLSTWNLALPPGCSNCDEGIGNIIDFALNTRLAAGAHYGLIVFPADATIADFFGYEDITGGPTASEQHAEKVQELFDAYFDNPSWPAHLRARAHYFALENQFHTTMIAGWNSFEVDGPTQLGDWINQFVTDDPAWTNLYEGSPVIP